MPRRPPIAYALRAGAVGLVVLLGTVSHGAGTAEAQSTTPSTNASATTSTIDQSLTTTPPLDVDEVPNYDNSPDLDMDRITGPRVEDGNVTSTTFWPLGFAAVAILAVFGTIFYRAARGNQGDRGVGRSGPKGAERGTPSQPASD